jgi:hypothetical protein
MKYVVKLFLQRAAGNPLRLSATPGLKGNEDLQTRCNLSRTAIIGPLGPLNYCFLLPPQNSPPSRILSPSRIFVHGDYA